MSVAVSDVVGHEATWPTGQYRAICTDRSLGGLVAGDRETGHGAWSLLHGGRVVNFDKPEWSQ